MTDISMDTLAAGAARQPRRDIGIKRRYAAERRFRLYGILAISFGILFLGIMLVTIISKGYTAFWQTDRHAADHLRREGDRSRQQAGNRCQCADRRQLSRARP